MIDEKQDLTVLCLPAVSLLVVDDALQDDALPWVHLRVLWLFLPGLPAAAQLGPQQQQAEDDEESEHH